MKQLLITKGQIVPSNEKFEVIGVFNAGCVEFDKKTILLLRVAERVKKESAEYLEIPLLDVDTNKVIIRRFFYNDKNFNFSDPRIIQGKETIFLTSMSHFRLAEIENGKITIATEPTIMAQGEYEVNGIEDPRITKIDDKYYITYACSSSNGILCGCMETDNFKEFKRLGYAFHPDNKDMVIFPEKIGKNYYCLHRPSTTSFGKRSIWLAESPDLKCWGNHKVVIDPRENHFDSSRVGAGAPPILIDEGWLEIYHGANEKDEYAIGALLLDKNNPLKVLARSNEPILRATEDFEKSGFFSNVVFTCGAIKTENGIKIFYGAADECVAVVEICIEDIFKSF